MKLALLIMLATSGTAVADPALPRVLTAPTAWLPPDGSVIGTAGLDHRGAGSIDLGYGLGGLAGVELGVDTDDRECTTATCSMNALASAQWLARAAFRIGARQDQWFTGQPALALIVRETIGDTLRVGEADAVASRVIGLARIHGGVAVLDASDNGDHMGSKVRPLAGVELTAPQYPKTTLMGDVAWTPLFQATGSPAPEWVIGWGVRYQSFDWASIELDVRHRENEDLGSSTVMVRANIVLDRR